MHINGILVAHYLKQVIHWMEEIHLQVPPPVLQMITAKKGKPYLGIQTIAMIFLKSMSFMLKLKRVI